MDPDVVILNDFADFSGGANSVALRSAIGLANRGCSVTLFTAVGPADPSVSATPNLCVVCLEQKEILRDGNRMRALTRGAWNQTALRALRELLKTRNPARTVVHAHMWTKALSPSVFKAPFELGFPVAVTLHDYFIGCPNGGFYEYPAGRICRRQPMSFSCVACSCDRRNYGHKLWRAGRTFLQNRLVGLPARAAHFVGVSEFSLNILRSLLPPAARTTVVRNPVDCPDLGFAPVADNTAFVFIGRLVPEKGPRLFAEAARKASARAVFVGDGELRGELARDFPEVTITGWQSANDVTAWVRRARALVFASQWYETLGLVVVEAAANGVPAIVSNGCAAREIVVDGERGRHFTHGSVESLAGAMAELSNDPSLASRFGRAAYDWYWDRPWSTAAHVEELLDVYRGILGMPTNKAYSGEHLVH
jgi:glycosyltransferase involved in cell wall biosynthesis